MNKIIVAIDDQERNLDLLEEILSSFKEFNSYDIVTFSDPVKGLEFCNENKSVEVILLDQKMPNLTGIEFIDKYSIATPKNNQASIIMISATDSPEIIELVLQKGIDDYFNKPFNPGIMRARIINSIDKKNLRQSIDKERRVKQILLRTLIHDVLNPLSVAEMRLRKNSGEEFEKLRRPINAAIDIIKSIKDIEALESDKMALKLESFPASSLLNYVAYDLINQAEGKDITINVENKLDLDVNITSNSSILRFQVINNLLSNSIKFSKNGSSIDVTLEESLEKVVLVIRDYGIGMPKKILDALFSWEEKTSRPGTNQEKGTGFGMPIVRKFVSELGHEVEVGSWVEDSEENRAGTEFRVIFGGKMEI